MTAPPRAHTQRSTRPTNGPGVSLIAQAKGRPHMPWQRDALDVALEIDPATGLYHYGIVVVTVPRQSGKTTIEGDTADHRCLTKQRARVWITMQNGKTVDSWMREEHHADLAGAPIFGAPGTPGCQYIKSLRAGEVGVRWPVTSSTFYTFPPKVDALHSKQGDLVIVDEAWVHNAEAGADLRQAIRPTMATRKGAQLWVVSTEGTDASAYLEHYLSMGRASVGDPNARVCLVDYGIGPDVDANDLEAIAAAHPAYGHTIDLRSLQDARDEFVNAETGVFDEAGWARAYGNRPTKTSEAAIPQALWLVAGRPRQDIPERAGIALDVTPAGDRAAITAGWRTDDGHAYVEPITAGPSTRATVDLLIQLARTRRVPLVADRGSYAALELLDAVSRRAKDVTVQLLSMGEYAAACASFERGIRDDTVHHPNDDDLDAAVAVATRRPLGDAGWGWGRRSSSGCIAELVAATVSLRAFDTLPAVVSRPRVLSSRR